MSELTDLEICKRIAEIEGFTVSHGGDYIFDKKRDLVFKPLSPTMTAKGFCLELVEKHGLDLLSPDGQYNENEYQVNYFLNGLPVCGFVRNENPQRAILLAVLKKSNS